MKNSFAVVFTVSCLALSAAFLAPGQVQSSWTSIPLEQIRGSIAAFPSLLVMLPNGKLTTAALSGGVLSLSNGVATLTIPPGAQGPAGPTGPQGAEGQPGTGTAPEQIDSFLINCTSTPQVLCSTTNINGANVFAPMQQFQTSKVPTQPVSVYRNGLYFDPTNTTEFSNYAVNVNGNGTLTIVLSQPTADQDVITLRYR